MTTILCDSHSNLPQEADLNGHYYYEYFRSFYEGDEQKWAMQLNRQLTFFDEACEVTKRDGPR